MKNKTLGPFLGINNKLPDFALHVDSKGDFLRTADNVDIDDAGHVVRRPAATQVVAMADAHSLHMTSATTGFLARGLALYRFSGLPSAYAEVLVKVLTVLTPLSWVTIGDDHYYSNGTDSGRISSNSWYPLGMETPAAPATATIAGGLLAGWYQVSISYSNSVTGEEGGLSATKAHELAATGGIRVTLPGAGAAGATHVNIYLSAANGTVAYWLAKVVVATATYDCVTLGAGRESTGRFEAPLTAGTLFHSNGRLCSFSGRNVFVGEPYRYGYMLPLSGVLTFHDTVTLAVENQGGTFVAADQTYWIPGDLGNVEGIIQTVLPYGAVPGTAFAFPDKSLVGWFGNQGIVFGATSGEVEAVMTENVSVTPPASGTAIVFQEDYDVVVSCGWSVNLANKAATQYSDWDFTSLSGDYGTKADGIYVTRTTGLVDASVGFGKLNFDTEALKRLPNAYVGIDAEDFVEMTVTVPTGLSYTYPARSSGTDLEIQRVDVGKGLRANWFDVSLSNTGGSAFTLASISWPVANTSRRI